MRHEPVAIFDTGAYELLRRAFVVLTAATALAVSAVAHAAFDPSVCAGLLPNTNVDLSTVQMMRNATANDQPINPNLAVQFGPSFMPAPSPCQGFTTTNYTFLWPLAFSIGTDFNGQTIRYTISSRRSFRL